MHAFSIQSGSNGNCIYVEAGGVRLLFDAGVAGRTVRDRLAHHGRDVHGLTALILSHEHWDHSRSAGVFQRMFRVPIYVTAPTWRCIAPAAGPVHDVRHFQAGGRLEFGDVVVHTVRTPHDAVDGCGFVVSHEGRRLGILTDLGHPFASLRRILGELDAVYLESNYDPDMLEAGPYTEDLKRRIRGPRGHLSNAEAGDLVRTYRGRRLQWVMLSHLSEQNNEPGLALETFRGLVGRSFPVGVAGRYEVGEAMTL